MIYNKSKYVKLNYLVKLRKIIIITALLLAPVFSFGQYYDMNRVDPTEETTEIWNYLHSIYGKKMLTGVMSEYIFGGNRGILASTGKYTAIYGEDMNSWKPDRNGTESTFVWAEHAYYIRQAHLRGQIIQISWHWQGPHLLHNGVYDDKGGAWSSLTTEQWDDIVTPGTELYNTMIEDIDYHVEHFLKKLDIEGYRFPILFRPFHEIDGGWFWWTNGKDPAKSVKLWNILYDRINNHHNMNNLIWVWSNSVECTGGSKPPFNPSEYNRRAEFYPGDDKCDIIGVDLYDFNPVNRGTLMSGETYRDAWNMLEDITSNKMIALTEAEAFPDASKFFDDDYAPWLFCLPWYAYNYPVSDTFDQDITVWNKNQFSNENYIILENLFLSVDDLTINEVSIYPNPAKDIVSIKGVTTKINSVEVFNLNGKLVLETLNSNSFDVSDLNKGLYLVVVKNNRGKVVKKLIKE